MSFVKLKGISSEDNRLGQMRLISFKDIKGNDTEKYIISSFITNKGKLKDFLAVHGFSLELLTSENLANIQSELSRNDAPIITIVRKLGFYNTSYLNLSGEVWGENNKLIMLHPDMVNNLAKNHVSGDLKQWQKNVAPYALYSSRLMLVLTVALSGMLLHYSNVEMGGINLFGDSSTGKSTALIFGASIFGNKSYIQNWCGTEIAFEELAAEHNDEALFLDEIKLLDSDPKKAAEKVMMLIYKVTDGQAKKRSKNYQQKTLTWSGLSLLSAGEVSLEKTAINGKVTKMTGERVRLIDVPADAGAGLGIYDSLPVDIKEASQLSDKIKLLCERYHGMVKKIYIEGLIDLIKLGNNSLENEIQQHISTFIKNCLVDESNGQMVRFANRFAIAYAAGVIGIKLKILPYKKKDIFNAINHCYQSALKIRPMLYAEKVALHYKQITSILVNKNKYLNLINNTGCSLADVNKKRFVISTFANQKVIGIHSKYMTRMFDDCSLQKSVLKKLYEDGLLIMSSDKKNTLQLSYRGKLLKRRYCIKYNS